MNEDAKRLVLRPVGGVGIDLWSYSGVGVIHRGNGKRVYFADTARLHHDHPSVRDNLG